MSRRLLILPALVLLPLGLLLRPTIAGDGNKAGAPAAKDSAKVTFDKDIKPFLKKYCNHCHGGKRPRADLDLAKYTDEREALKQREVWQKVTQMLQAGEMPPPERLKPSQAEVEKIVDWIDHQVNKLDCTQKVDPGRVTLRRLNRAEYNNTIRDLIGLDLKPADEFPDDDVGHGFDNIGDVLTLSPLLLEKYLKASEKVALAAFNDPQSRAKILIRMPKDKDDQLEAARAILKNFARRAYRRPVRDFEVERLVQRFVVLAEKKGDSFEKGIQLAVQAMLVSPHFLFRVERDQPIPRGQAGHLITEFELANRLSYFLWSTMPDEELFRLAEQKQLRQGDNLEKQVRRMMQDASAQALVENFAGQWLALRNLRRMTPDPDVFPTFDDALRLAMIKETELFFAAVMKEDRPIGDFLDADYTFVNERLAKHYGISGVEGKEFRKVALTNGERGGLLGQGSILTLTSNPTRTSPVNRGKWIMENILGTPPPPPPPDVPMLEEGKQAALTGSLRKRMEMHRQNALCASCHAKMDPLGFGLENFDGIGAWRDKDGQFPIDATGTLPSGQSFNGPRELRRLLKSTKAGDFRRLLVEKMLIYSLGRGLEYYDRCAVDKICQTMEQQQNRFSTMIVAIVRSDPFQMRRGKGGNK
jgi:hypothetical protein